MLKFPLRRLYESLLCTLLAASLARNVTEGFLLPERLYGVWIPVLLLSAAVISVCAVISRDAHLRKPFLLGTASLVTVLLTFCVVKDIPLTETGDPEQNAALWFILVIGCSLLVWLCGRTKTGSGILVVSGILLQCGVSVLEFPFSLPALLIYLICAGLLFALRGTECADTLFPASVRHVLFQLVVGVCALFCGAVLCYAVLMPFELPTVDLRLFTEFISPDLLNQAGLIDDTVTFSEGSSQSGSGNPSSGNSASGDAASPESSDPSAGRADDMPTDDGGGITRYLNRVSALDCVLFGITLFLLLLLLLFFRRHICLLRLFRKDSDRQLFLLYGLILHEFILLGLPGQDGDTPAEYAARIKIQTDAFSAKAGDWSSLAERYVRFCYAGESADSACVSAFRHYYLSLPNLPVWKLRKLIAQINDGPHGKRETA